VRVSIAVPLSLLLACGGGAASAAFECLPGPARGGLSDWLWDPAGPRRGFAGCAAFGSPAAIPDLGWSWAEIRFGTGRRGLRSGLYFLRFADVYRESVAGLVLDHGRFSIGARRWEVLWDDDALADLPAKRHGWTACAEARASWKRAVLRLAGEGVALGRPDAAAPPPRSSFDLDLGLGGGIRAGAAGFRTRDGSGWIGRASFAPLQVVTLRQEVVWPGNALRSEIEMRVGRIGTDLWIEPSTALGPRVGVRCSFQ